MFIRALKKNNHESEGQFTQKARGLTDDPRRLQHVREMKHLPLAPSAKAPYGTDNNIYIRGVHLPENPDPIISTAINEVISGPLKSHASVPGAINVFEESCVDENESVYSETLSELPPHLKPSMLTVSSQPSDADYADFSCHRSSCSSRRMSDYCSHILPGFVADDPKYISRSRRHFESYRTNKNILEWSAEPTVLSENALIRTPKSKPCNILAHHPEIPPVPYRPSSRVIALDSTCPFATDADDLSQLRDDLLRIPLGKVTPPSHAT
jgi:hypothetical protein